MRERLKEGFALSPERRPRHHRTTRRPKKSVATIPVASTYRLRRCYSRSFLLTVMMATFIVCINVVPDIAAAATGVRAVAAAAAAAASSGTTISSSSLLKEDNNIKGSSIMLEERKAVRGMLRQRGFPPRRLTQGEELDGDDDTDNNDDDENKDDNDAAEEEQAKEILYENPLGPVVLPPEDEEQDEAAAMNEEWDVEVPGEGVETTKTTAIPTAAPVNKSSAAPVAAATTSAPVAAKTTTAATPVTTATSAPTEGTEEFEPEDAETEQDDDDIFDKDFYNNLPGNNTNSNLENASSLSVFATLLGIFAMIFTAWQMQDNPDGIFASLCRLIITSIQLLCRILFRPCRKCLPCCCRGSGGAGGNYNGYHEPYGHLPTMDYGYKDPSLELS